ncbi:MAG: hypothetical protein FJ041_07400, partial [Candidatus Cloacimonetes bacterium]|nr:hypothetical protein [Candidatus Cloacimonadota bacterium]
GSSIFNNLQIEPFTIDGGAPWTVTFQDNVISDDVVYYAVTEDKKKIPKAIRANIPSNLKSVDNSAECLIITIKEFISDPGTMLFKQLWEQRGYQVQVIDLQDIFDEFNYGIRSAESIKDFITFAYNNWAEPQLKSVLFLGDGTDDERDSSSSNKFNIIPVKKLWTYKHGATACDNWYGCVVGTDPIPDVSISRINVWKADQILPIAQKSHRYLNEPNYDKLWHSNVTLTSGGKSSDGSDIFSQQSEYIRRNKIPNFYRVSRVYTNTQTVSHDFWGLTPQLISKINDGTVFLQFMGHGGGRIWADYNLFNFGNVASLTNQNYAIVSSLACYCSAFDTKGSASISETFVMQPNKGAIATIGFSGLGYLYDDVNYGLALTEGILAKDFDTLGEAYNYAKARFYVSTSSVSAQIALIQGGVLLGDHNIKVIKPQSGVVVNTDKDVYAVNDTIRVTATFPAPVNAARTYIMKQTETVVNPPNELPVTPNGYAYSYNITGNVNDKYYRKIYVAGHSNTGEYYGFKDIAVGKGLLTNMGSVPQIPTWNDSIRFQVKVTGIDNMATLNCRVRLDSISTNPTWFSFPMIPSGNDDNVYITQNALSSQVTGKEVFFKYRAVLSNNNTVESFLNSLVVAGPELLLSDMQFISDNNNLGVKVQIKNIGNARSSETTIRLYATQT